MAYQSIILDLEGPLAIVTFNRPDKLNALSAELIQEFSQAIEDIQLNTARGLVYE